MPSKEGNVCIVMLSDCLIRPEKLIGKENGAPKVVISTFSFDIISKIVERMGAKRIGGFLSANGEMPLYMFEYKNYSIGLYCSRVGAPACVIQFEDLMAMGADTLIYFGSCGALDASISEGAIVIPNYVYCDEGTSKKYCKGIVGVQNGEKSKQLVRCSVSEKLNVYEGNIWTTDAFYHESVDDVKRFIDKGCIAVDMECSALLTVASVLGKRVVPFLYAADSINENDWDKRDLDDNGNNRLDEYFNIALNCAINIYSTKETEEDN